MWKSSPIRYCIYSESFLSPRSTDNGIWLNEQTPDRSRARTVYYVWNGSEEVKARDMEFVLEKIDFANWKDETWMSYRTWMRRVSSGRNGLGLG